MLLRRCCGRSEVMEVVSVWSVGQLVEQTIHSFTLQSKKYTNDANSSTNNFALAQRKKTVNH